MTSLLKTAPFRTLSSAVLLYRGLVWQGISLSGFGKYEKQGISDWLLVKTIGLCYQKKYAKTINPKYSIYILETFMFWMRMWNNFPKLYPRYSLIYHFSREKNILSQQVESVSLSSLGKCGEFNTYSQYPDMNSDVWASIKVGRNKSCVWQTVLYRTVYRTVSTNKPALALGGLVVLLFS